MKQQAIYKIIGMQKDVADSAMDKQHAFDIHNMRFRHTDTNSLAALVNEEGNKPAVHKDGGVVGFVGTVIGSTVLNDTAIVFTHTDSQSTPDRIYLVEDAGNNTYSSFLYFCGDLQFSTENPIECTAYFENEEVQKVYWVDGKNPLRYANIADRNDGAPWDDGLRFDSVPKLSLREVVTVKRNDTGGVFPSGTVQWCFTYLTRYGAESNIAWTSPIHYSSPNDRGGAPGENCSNSFTIEIQNPEAGERFDYIRLYHIVHTTLDTEAEVRRVADIPISTTGATVVYTDTNTTGETVEPAELLYLGGISVVPQTIEQKSNTLFLGNLDQKYDYIRDVLKKTSGLAWGNVSTDTNAVSFVTQVSTVPVDQFSGYYSHQNQLLHNSYNITSFQRGEAYRFGFQAQDNTGRWSDVWWLGDFENTDQYPKFNDGFLNVVHATYTVPQSVVNKLYDKGYRKVRPVVVYPEPWERNILTEGLLNPTVYNAKDRASNAPFAQSSWFLRPFSPVDFYSLGLSEDWAGNIKSSGSFTDDSEYYPFSEGDYYSTATWSDISKSIAIDPIIKHIGNDDYAIDIANYGSWSEFRHNHPLGDSQQRNGEIQSMYNRRPAGEDEQSGASWNVAKYRLTLPYVKNNDAAKRDFINTWADFFFVDQSILTMNSADIDFDSTLQVTKFDDCKMRIVGIAPMSSFISSFDIMTNTPPNKFREDEDEDSSLNIPQGFYGSEVIGASMDHYEFGWRSLVSAAIWHDEFAYSTIDNGRNPKYSNKELAPIGFAVYPWQGSGSLNNDSVGTKKSYGDNDDGAQSRVGDNYISAELKEKTIANLHYSYSTHSVTNLGYCIPLNVDAVTVLDEQGVSLTKLEPDNSGLGTLHYFGSADKLITPVSGFVEQGDNKARPLTRRGGYPRMASYLPMFMRNYEGGFPSHVAFYSPYAPISFFNTLTGVNGQAGANNSFYPHNANFTIRQGGDRSMSPISIRYKSGNHIAIALDYSEGRVQNCLGWHAVNSEIVRNTAYPPAGSGTVPFWSDYTSFKELSVVNTMSFDGVTEGHDEEHPNLFKCFNFDYKTCGFLYVGQLFRNSVQNRFGGTSDEAVEKNVWLPAGEAVPIHSNKSAVITWAAGDTYYQRYDALRTYPFAEEDKNKVIDIVSFMTETHTNIDGRYDKNRGLSNNNHVRPQNFNKMNYVYSQRDNFFTYHAININKVHLDTFNYSFTWTASKVPGSLRDEWTRITLANTYDCDGNKGPINSITRLDNNLVAFQSGGVAQILFNETSQVQATDGLPFELANSGKMQGLRYCTTEIGCQNKWSIGVFPNGIYWVDGRINEFCVLGSNGIEQVSTTKLMSSWFKNSKDFITPWKPVPWTGFISHRDITTGEMFLTNNDTCLCFDTMTGEFTSFYDYQNTFAMFAINGKVLTVAKEANGTRTLLWQHRQNTEHCTFYGQQYPFSVEIVCNSNNQSSDYGFSKIFDNMSWRSDAWQYGTGGWGYQPFITFTRMHGTDDYQRFDRVFTNTYPESQQTSHPSMPIDLRKKFKVWYTTIPRALDENNNETRDRIRDTWCHITLEGNTSVSFYRHIVHDLTVTYFIP